MILHTNYGESIEMTPVNKTKYIRITLLTPKGTHYYKVLKKLYSRDWNRRDLIDVLGFEISGQIKALKHWGLVTKYLGYYTLTELGERYIELVEDKRFTAFSIDE